MCTPYEPDRNSQIGQPLTQVKPFCVGRVVPQTRAHVVPICLGRAGLQC